ncbi:MAG TPA: hypothetical protein VK835_02050 [Bacteroidia bacterium]|jgi:hypothetical protein|nr:hypothetical protein [Bacteroidia bacterium]
MKKTVFILLIFCSMLFISSCTKSSYGLTPYANKVNTPIYNTVPPTPNNISTLGGTKWVLYQYKDATMQNPLAKNDTLIFIDSLNYTYNNIANTYELKTSNLSGRWSFRLYGTPFGDLTGTPATNFKTYGEITDVPFTQVGPSNPVTYSLWLKKL